MRMCRLLTVASLISLTAASCAPRQIKPVADIDPLPLIERVTQRRKAFERGLSGILELDLRQGKKRFRGKAYIVAFPDGRFRLEVPGPMGSTLMIMADNGDGLLAYYPEEGIAYRSFAGGPYTNPHLPFPLPVGPDEVTTLMMGIYPQGTDISETGAVLLDSGEKRLRVATNDDGLQHIYLFTREPVAALRLIRAQGQDLELEVTTKTVPPHFPHRFVIVFPDASVKGVWESVDLFNGDESVLQLNIPESVPITDLGSAF